MKLTKKQILDIPKLKETGKTNDEIGEMYGVTGRTIEYWVKRFRKTGRKIDNAKPGRQALDLTQ